MPHRTFRALIDDRAFDLTLEGDTLTLDGTPRQWTFEPVGDGCFSLLVDGRSVSVVVRPLDDGRLRVHLDGHTHTVQVQDEHDLLLERFGLADITASAEREVRAPMPGLVLNVMVQEGESVEAGDGLLVLEAMKMENELHAPAAGTIGAIHVAVNDAVDKDALLIEIVPENAR